MNVDYSLPTVDINPDGTLVVNESRREVKAGVRCDASAKATVPWGIKPRSTFVRERWGSDHDQ
jgi:hypothetical protein